MITTIVSTLDVKITILRCQYLGLHFGRTSKHLGKFIHEVVPTCLMTHVDSFVVNKIHLIHEESIHGYQRTPMIETCKILGAKCV